MNAHGIPLHDQQVVSTDYISWMFNGTRQFITATMIFGAFDLMVRKKHFAFAIVVLLASQIHGSAILMLPLAYVMHGPAMNKRVLLILIGVIAIIPFMDRVLPLVNDLLADTQYSGTMTDEIWTADDGTNPIRVLVYAVPALMALVGRRYVTQADDPVINLCVNASVITAVIYVVSMLTSGIYRWLCLRLSEKRFTTRRRSTFYGIECTPSFYGKKKRERKQVIKLFSAFL